MAKDDEIFEDEDGVEVDEELDTEDDVVADDDEAETVTGPVIIAEEDVDEEDGPDTDVELALDEVLAERVRVTTDEEDDDDDEPLVDLDEKLDQSETVLPQQDDEFRCSSCRLLKKNSQLADKKQQLCRDCI